MRILVTPSFARRAKRLHANQMKRRINDLREEVRGLLRNDGSQLLHRVLS